MKAIYTVRVYQLQKGLYHALIEFGSTKVPKLLIYDNSFCKIQFI